MWLGRLIRCSESRAWPGSRDERLVKNESMLDTLEDEGVYSFAMKRLLENKNEVGAETFVVNLLKEGAEKRRDRTK